LAVSGEARQILPAQATIAAKLPPMITFSVRLAGDSGNLAGRFDLNVKRVIACATDGPSLARPKAVLVLILEKPHPHKLSNRLRLAGAAVRVWGPERVAASSARIQSREISKGLASDSSELACYIQIAVG